LSSEDTISWTFNEKSKTLFIKDDLRAGKYFFHKTKDAITEEEYQRKVKEAGVGNKIVERPKYEFLYISWEVPSDDTIKINNETEEEVNEILKLITLQTNFKMNLRGSYVVPGDPKKLKTLHGRSTLLPPIKELEPDILKKAVKYKEKIYASASPKKEYLLRAIEWYHKGTQETDRTNSFADYWIGFETLTFWFDGEEESIGKCDKCGQSLHVTSISKRMKDFARKINSSFSNTRIDDLFCIRSGLFHKSREIDIKDRNDVQKLLQECITLCLNLD
jgi:hypothetical protein